MRGLLTTKSWPLLYEQSQLWRFHDLTRKKRAELKLLVEVFGLHEGMHALHLAGMTRPRILTSPLFPSAS